MAWVVLVLGVVVTVFVLSFYFKAKRREAFRAFAARHGLRYSETDTFGLLGWPFALFQKGDGRGIDNVLWGAWPGGEQVTAFDYWYYTESTDSKGSRSRTYKRFSCAMVQVSAAFPHLEIARENLFTRMADGMGLEDIELELPEFNRRFNVKAVHRKFAYEVLETRMMDWLVASDAGYAYEIVGNQILAYGKKGKVEALLPLVGALLAFRDRIPRVAWTLYPARSA